MSELKKCPFCGGKAYIKKTPDYGSEKPRLFAACCVCGVETPRIARNKKEAISAWNRRAQENEPLTEIEQAVARMIEEGWMRESLADLCKRHGVTESDFFGYLYRNTLAERGDLCRNTLAERSEG